MANPSKRKGTAAESAVVAYLRPNGFPHAERRALAGALDVADILATVGVVIEVKGGLAAETASDAQIASWLDETERERVNARASVALLVTKRKGKGAANAGQWWAHLRLSTLDDLADAAVPVTDAIRAIPVRVTLADAVTLLRAAGYGSELDAPAVTA